MREKERKFLVVQYQIIQNNHTLYAINYPITALTVYGFQYEALTHVKLANGRGINNKNGNTIAYI